MIPRVLPRLALRGRLAHGARPNEIRTGTPCMKDQRRHDSDSQVAGERHGSEDIARREQGFEAISVDLNQLASGQRYFSASSQLDFGS